VPQCQIPPSSAANIPFQYDFFLEGIVTGSGCAYPCLSTQRPFFNLSGNFYLNTTYRSLTGTSTLHACESWVAGREKFLSLLSPWGNI